MHQLVSAVESLEDGVTLSYILEIKPRGWLFSPRPRARRKRNAPKPTPLPKTLTPVSPPAPFVPNVSVAGLEKTSGPLSATSRSCSARTVSETLCETRRPGSGVTRKSGTLRRTPVKCQQAPLSPPHPSLTHISEPTRLGLISSAVFCLNTTSLQQSSYSNLSYPVSYTIPTPHL